MDRKRVLDSFVARLWLEKGSGEDVVLRGHIRQIKGTQEVNFQGLGEMSEFITEMSGLQIRDDEVEEDQ